MAIVFAGGGMGMVGMVGWGGDWKKIDQRRTLLGWLESKMRLESFYIWVKLRFRCGHVWCPERRRKRVERGCGGGGGGGSLCLCSVCVWPSGRSSDGHSSGWPLPGPGPGPHPAGTGSRARRPSAAARTGDLWTRWSHDSCYPSVALTSSLPSPLHPLFSCASYFTFIC